MTEDISGRAVKGKASCSAMDDDFGEGARAAASKPRRRQYRVKSDVTGS